MSAKSIVKMLGVGAMIIVFSACLPTSGVDDDGAEGGGLLVDENGRGLDEYSEDEFVPKMFTDDTRENDACGGCPGGGCPDNGGMSGNGGCGDCPGGNGGCDGCPGGCPDPGGNGGGGGNGGNPQPPSKSQESCAQACYNLVTCIQDMCPLEVLDYFSDDVIGGCTAVCMSDPNWQDPSTVANASCGDIGAGICMSMPVVDAFCDCSGGSGGGNSGGGNGGDQNPPPPRK